MDACRDDWDRTSADLTANDLRLALDVCDETSRELSDLSCAQVNALYVVEE